MENYDHKKIESKWQKAWADEGIYKTPDSIEGKENFYTLVEFAYPSGNLHVGHWYAFGVPDMYARMKRMQGKNVLFPFGFDSFGLPAENAAIKNNVDPKKWTYENIDRMRAQLKTMGAMFDWDREVITSDPEYYKWTQWLFIQMFNAGMVGKKKSIVNWDPVDQTVLANEQVLADGTAERSGAVVEKRELEEWAFKITDYADRLIDDLDTLDWPEPIKEAQRQWIGRSEGAEISFSLSGLKEDKKKFVIFDFDGVIGDTFEASVGAKVAMGNTREEASASTILYASRKPHHARGVEQTVLDTTDKWYEEFRAVIMDQKEHLKLFPEMVKYIESHPNLQYAIVSSGCQNYIQYLLEKTSLKPTHVLAYEDHHSKEEKVELICKDWDVALDEVYYVTDTKADVYELEEILPKKNIIACSWGYLGREPLLEVLPPEQVLDTVSEFDNFFGEQKIKVFTTRPDTLFGVTYVVLAPEHPLVATLLDQVENRSEVETYINQIKNKSELERQQSKEKTGVELRGIAAINPANNESVPVWIADYVLAGYGTGAVMAVPAHDERDFEFAKKYKLPSINVVQPFEGEVQLVHDLTKISEEESFKLSKDHYQLYLDGLLCYSNSYADSKLRNSAQFNGLSSEEAKKKITEFVNGTWKTTYKIRDWGISRQRYWGCPIPIVYDPQGKAHPIPDEHLPWVLPTDVDFTPDGTAPLARSEELKKRTEEIFGKGWMSEVDTMDVFVDSSWYFLRYLAANNDQNFSLLEIQKNWMPVDFYSGGAEHTTVHLLYSRFFQKALFDLGLVAADEPYKKRMNRSLILAEDGRKMSKRWGNTVDPDEQVNKVGADSVRVYLAFIGPYNEVSSYPWSYDSLVGVRRFIEKVWRIAGTVTEDITNDNLRVIHKTIKKVGENLERLKTNTAVSALMECATALDRTKRVSKNELELFLKLLAPLAPHMTEEIWRETLGHTASIHLENWPEFDPALIVDELVTVGVQINGKMRGTIEIAPDATEDEAKATALALDTVIVHLNGALPKKVIYVPGRIVNIVV